MGSELGVPDEKILALGEYAASPFYDERERAALEYAGAITLSGRDVGDDLFERVRGLFGDDALVELTAAIAWENSSSEFNRALRVPSQGLWKRPGYPFDTPPSCLLPMSLYIDHHKNLEGLTAKAVAEDHKKDLQAQDKHGANTLRYWFNEEKGEVYCLFEAPNAEVAEAVHREAHGNVADEIMEVKEGS